MKMNMKFLSAWTFSLGVSVASAAEFPYGVADSQMTERFKATSVEATSLTTPVTVPQVSAMPATDSIATLYTGLAEFAANDEETWTSATTAIGTPQAALTMRLVDGVGEWWGFTAGNWVKLTGVTPEEGEWVVKIDIDYSLGANARKIRYQLKKETDAAYTSLRLNDVEWLDIGVEGNVVSGVKLYGFGMAENVVARSGMRPLGAASAVECYNLSYSDLTIKAAVTDAWNVEKVQATVKKDGADVGTVDGTLAPDGTCALNLAKYVKPGESYTYDLKLLGKYDGNDQTQVVKSDVKADMFSNIDWFGFDGAGFVQATGAGVTVEANAFKATTGKGTVTPAAAERDGSETVLKAQMNVAGVYQWDDLPALTPQFAITLARTKNDDITQLGTRTWAVKTGSGAWTAVSANGLSTDNGVYDVKVTLDYRDGHRKGVYEVKAASAEAYVQLAEFDLAATKLNNAAVVGGSISGLNASYKSVGPAEIVPSGDSIVLSSSTTVDLAKIASLPEGGFTVSSADGKKYYMRWKDSGTRYAKLENGRFVVVDGQPLNGYASFMSHVLGLDPTKSTDKPCLASEQVAETDMIQLSMPNVKPRAESETGVAVTYQLKTSDNPTAFLDEPIATTNEPTFKVGVPSADEKVKYYKVDIKLAD